VRGVRSVRQARQTPTGSPRTTRRLVHPETTISSRVRTNAEDPQLEHRTDENTFGIMTRGHVGVCSQRDTRGNMARKKSTIAAPPTFDEAAWAGVDVQRVEYQSGQRVFGQGDAATSVMYIDAGRVRLSVVSPGGKEAVVAVLDAGMFFGEGCLAGQPLRIATATAMAKCSVLVVAKAEMAKRLHERPAFSDRFLAHMLTRNIRIEEDLVDQLFNSSEKRLARTLLLLSRYGDQSRSLHVLPKLSQELLAEMVGTTRSRVNFFMNKFRRLGFIEYNGDGLTIHGSLLSVVLHD
jgi:CRP-like cAMP-binding protein